MWKYLQLCCPSEKVFPVFCYQLIISGHRRVHWENVIRFESLTHAEKNKKYLDTLNACMNTLLDREHLVHWSHVSTNDLHMVILGLSLKKSTQLFLTRLKNWPTAIYLIDWTQTYLNESQGMIVQMAEQLDPTSIKTKLKSYCLL